MNKKLSSLLLLLVLTVTDAYLLSHPNLVGKIGIIIFKHSYIRTFPKALLTVGLTVGISLLICELLTRFAARRTALGALGAFFVGSMLLFAYVYNTFSNFTYSITGKAFIYGAHLLPVILVGLSGRYLVRQMLFKKITPLAPDPRHAPADTLPPVPEP